MLNKGTFIYFTATNLYWKPLMQNDSYKDIVMAALQFLVKKQCVDRLWLCDYDQSYALIITSTIDRFKASGHSTFSDELYSL